MERKQAPTLKEQRKSNPGKTFEILDEDVCILVKGRGDMPLEVPRDFGGMHRTGLVSGREGAGAAPLFLSSWKWGLYNRPEHLLIIAPKF